MKSKLLVLLVSILFMTIQFVEAEKYGKYRYNQRNSLKHKKKTLKK